MHNRLGVTVYKVITSVFLAATLVFTSVGPTVTFAASKPSASQLNSIRELRRAVQMAIRDEIASVGEEIDELKDQLEDAETRSERIAILIQIRPLRSELRRLTNRLRRSRHWSIGQIYYWAGIYLPPDVSPA